MIFYQKKEVRRLVRQPSDCLCNREASGARIDHADTPFLVAHVDGSRSHCWISNSLNPTRRPAGVSLIGLGSRPAVMPL